MASEDVKQGVARPEVGLLSRLPKLRTSGALLCGERVETSVDRTRIPRGRLRAQRGPAAMVRCEPAQQGERNGGTGRNKNVLQLFTSECCL
jgi:hypothetical protein